MLSPEESELLEGFVARNDSNAPYWRRVNILLLSDAGRSPEEISVELGSTVTQTRRWLNVYKRQGLAAIPEDILRPPAPYSADDHIAVAARVFLLEQLTIIEEHAPALEAEGAPVAVHETRKAIRRSRNAIALVAPYYTEDLFSEYRRRLRNTMRSLGPARDLFVLLLKLDRYIEQGDYPAEAQDSLQQLRSYWESLLAHATDEAQMAVKQARYRRALKRFGKLVREEGKGVAPAGEPIMPAKVRHLAPMMITARLTDVLAFGDYVNDAPLDQLHTLRIHFKHFRYTLDLFTPVLGNEVLVLVGELNRIQTHLGDLQDARITLERLDEMQAEVGKSAGINLYRQEKEAEISQLVHTFGQIWSEFDTVQWRRKLSASMANL
jgi:CHAD domain-containing protein